ncbi:MAG TPA: hypothetical protein VM782_03210 [Stellaceae bacterium]|nr:hypothetical protein [Stellaceae bacterium]
MLLFLLIAFGLAKGALLLVNRPSFLWDSGDYVKYADAILDHGRAFAPVNWGAEAMPKLIFRPPGYPLFLAAAKLISPSGFATVAVIGQTLLNGIAVALIFVVAARLLGSSIAALAATTLYAASGSLLWDNAILSDSLFASLWNIVVFTLLGQLLGCWRVTFLRGLGLGLSWGCAVWVRDAGLYFTLLPVLLMLLLAVREWRHFLQTLMQLTAFLLMVAAMVGGLVLLNLHRTGELVFSITGVANWLQPIFEMQRRGYAQPFTGDDLISTAARETLTNYNGDDQLRFIDELHSRCRCTPTQLQSLEFSYYLAAVKRFPVAYARVVISNFNYFALGELVADPVATLDQFLELGADKPEWRIPGFSLRHLTPLLQHFDLAALVLMLLSALAELISALIFTAYLLGTPYLLWRALRRRQITAETIAIGFLWLNFLGLSLVFSLVHYEARYALPVLPAATIGIVFVVRRLLEGRNSAAPTE